MRTVTLATGCFYHIYNRGVEKRDTYLGKRDYIRFLETMVFYSLDPIPIKFSDYKRGWKGITKEEDRRPLVRILCYCLMTNHYHLLVQQLEDNGIAKFCHRLSDSYTKFFNTKYERVGSLFQGPFQAKLIESDEYMLQLSRYIHRNPLSKGLGIEWPYSSYLYYLSTRKDSACDTTFINEYFSKKNINNSYQSFVEESDSVDPQILGLLIDEQD